MAVTRTERVVALSGGDALMGRELKRIGTSCILVEDGSIAAAGPLDEIRVPPGAERIDTTGTTVVPGFIDAHVHIGFAAPHDVVSRGVTTVRDLGWPERAIHTMIARSQHDVGWPLILAAGPIFTAPGGYPTRAAWAPVGTGLEITSADHGRDEVRRCHDEGSCAIKVALEPAAGPVLPAATLAAIVGEAHAAGLKVTGHVNDVAHVRIGLDAGIDELAHMILSDEEMPGDLVEELVSRDVAMVPTLSIWPRRRSRRAVSNLRSFVAAGGRVLYGTDLGNSGPRPGIDRTEVERMEAAGMSVDAIVRAATVEAAAWLGLDRKGRIEPGFEADLVVLSGGLDRARDLTKVELVMRSGTLVS